MARYTSQYIIFDVSDDWIDQSITAFKIPGQTGRGDASFVVTTDPTRSGKTFDAYYEEQRSKCEKSLPGFRSVRSKLMEAHGRAMGWLEFTWQNSGNTVQIRQIIFDCDPLAVICTLTAAPEDIPLIAKRWNRLMKGVEFPATDPPEAFDPRERPE